MAASSGTAMRETTALKLSIKVRSGSFGPWAIVQRICSNSERNWSPDELSGTLLGSYFSAPGFPRSEIALDIHVQRHSDRSALCYLLGAWRLRILPNVELLVDLEGDVGVLHGAMSYLLQDDDGQIIEPHSISAGLDYPGVGPEHSFLKDVGRAEYFSVTDEEALEAFKRVSRLEGIIPALETSHALAHLENLLVILAYGREFKSLDQRVKRDDESSEILREPKLVEEERRRESAEQQQHPTGRINELNETLFLFIIDILLFLQFV
ncbi:unnamed protein product [Arabidopsis thaliana]|uniref:(thale cress) hypothetical protein n=1 Tax=Arabidopsis thaliana TaxID=3702 RepID=A0A7G2F7T1_ARATH|nr:unnamed protein product [Arabidopsis thaliana]